MDAPFRLPIAPQARLKLEFKSLFVEHTSFPPVLFELTPFELTPFALPFKELLLGFPFSADGWLTVVGGLMWVDCRLVVAGWLMIIGCPSPWIDRWLVVLAGSPSSSVSVSVSDAVSMSPKLVTLTDRSLVPSSSLSSVPVFARASSSSSSSSWEAVSTQCHHHGGV
eukprot:CAMPEP_0197852288 /NCGR_PEP_ID=MMETSP1438-20131217/20190_1 /TAXON_ID=1461541 /ORGANISM="Pterosperma sp., Strain CCMP1384" /LENGTH=166 /DNA_ID=CAMNT_0043466261 /DNA_START=291 /DNA_END=791 /DNA_ORIENTATION=+